MARSTIGETGGFVNDADAVDAMMVSFYVGAFLANYIMIRPLLDVPAGAEKGMEKVAEKVDNLSKRLKSNGVSWNPYNPYGKIWWNNPLTAGMRGYSEIKKKVSK